MWSLTHFIAVRHLSLCGSYNQPERAPKLNVVLGCWIQQRQPDLKHSENLVNVQSLSFDFPGHKCAYEHWDGMNTQPIVGYLFGLRLQELSIRSFMDMVGTRNAFRTVKKLHSRRSMRLARLAEFNLPLLEHLSLVVSV